MNNFDLKDALEPKTFALKEVELCSLTSALYINETLVYKGPAAQTKQIKELAITNMDNPFGVAARYYNFNNWVLIAFLAEESKKNKLSINIRYSLVNESELAPKMQVLNSRMSKAYFWKPDLYKVAITIGSLELLYLVTGKVKLGQFKTQEMANLAKKEDLTTMIWEDSLIEGSRPAKELVKLIEILDFVKKLIYFESHMLYKLDISAQVYNNSKKTFEKIKTGTFTTRDIISRRKMELFNSDRKESGLKFVQNF